LVGAGAFSNLRYEANISGIKNEPNEKYIVNVGSVGQPRDGDPRSCFVIFDPETGKVNYVRLKYEVERTYQKIIKSGLPTFLAERLLKGY
jgi:diadenosine tetraphosphatase ApaH/serine/threonine PP2A family protein phosphatase